MRKVCLINSYNYEEYLDFCLDSVVGQTTKFDRIYVVDDGSTDGSKSIIEGYDKNFPEVVPIYKANGGQLSCFNTAVDYIRDDDWVFLLDADDIYPKDYLEQFLKAGLSDKYAMYFCHSQEFETDDELPVTSVRNSAPAIVISGSSQLTRLTKCWVGKPTSAMVVAGELFRRIFPYPGEPDWVTRADDILVYASSLAGYEKVFIPSLCVGYRVHGGNSFVGKKFSRRYKKQRKLAVRKLFLWYSAKFSLKRNPSLLSAIDEFGTSKEYYQMIGKIKVWKILIKYLIYVFFETVSLDKVAADLNRQDSV